MNENRNIFNSKRWGTILVQNPGIAAVLIVLTLFTYRNVFDNSFVDWDDYTYVVDNPLVRDTDGTGLKEIFTEKVSLNYHPLTILSLRLNNNVCNECRDGISPAPFIRWNVTLHILNTILVFIFIMMLTGGRQAASFFVAAVFAVHPMHVESVAWISERKDVLYTLFYIGGLISWTGWLKSEATGMKKPLLYVATLVLFLLSCLSKAMAVSFPLAMILVWLWTGAEDGSNRLTLKKTFLLLPFLVLSTVFGIAAVAINNPNSFSLINRLHYAGYGFTMYLLKFIVPFGLSPLYPYPSHNVLYTGIDSFVLASGPFIMVFLLVILVARFRKKKALVFGAAFFIVTIVMVLQVISVGAAIMADRYSYIPYIGLAFIPAVLADRLDGRLKNAVFALMAVFIAAMSFIASRQAEVWNNSETLWNRVIRFYPYDETARSIRGIYYMKLAAETGDEKNRERFEEKAFADFAYSLKAQTARADVWENAGIIYAKNNNADSALVCLDKAVELRPEKGSAYFNRALVYEIRGKKEEAISDYSLALRYQPGNALKIINNRSNLYLETGRYSEAEQDFSYLITKDRTNSLYFSNRAYARLMSGDIPGAVTDYIEALRLNPRDELSREQLNKLLSGGKPLNNP